MTLYHNVSIQKFLLLSIVSFGIYPTYWFYKNWKYIRNKEGRDISPFWRAIFGLFYCYGLFKEIRSDKEMTDVVTPDYNARLYAALYIVLSFLSPIPTTVIGHQNSIVVFLFNIPAFAAFIPVLYYINKVNSKLGGSLSDWSRGETVCVVFGIISWIFITLSIILKPLIAQ